MHHEPVIFTGIFGAGSIFALLATAVLQKSPEPTRATPSPDVDTPTKVSPRPVVITSPDAEGEPPTLIMDRALLPVRPPPRRAPAPLPSVPDRPWLDIAIWVLVGLGCGALIALGFVHG